MSVLLVPQKELVEFKALIRRQSRLASTDESPLNTVKWRASCGSVKLRFPKCDSFPFHASCHWLFNLWCRRCEWPELDTPVPVSVSTICPALPYPITAQPNGGRSLWQHATKQLKCDCPKGTRRCLLCVVSCQQLEHNMAPECVFQVEKSYLSLYCFISNKLFVWYSKKKNNKRERPLCIKDCIKMFLELGASESLLNCFGTSELLSKYVT